MGKPNNMIQIDQKQQRNLYIFIGVLGAIASGFTIWNHIGNYKMRKIQSELLALQKKKLQSEMQQAA